MNQKNIDEYFGNMNMQAPQNKGTTQNSQMKMPMSNEYIDTLSAIKIHEADQNIDMIDTGSATKPTINYTMKEKNSDNNIMPKKIYQMDNKMSEVDTDGDILNISLGEALAKNIGEYVVVEFLIGKDRLVKKQGILYNVGLEFITLYDEMAKTHTLCDIFTIRFVTYYPTGKRPPKNNQSK